MSARLLAGDALTVLRTLPDGIVRCCVTSPPYWGLRDYGMLGQIGLEKTPEEYVGKLVEVFREVRRVLSDDGTLWLNLGDSYAATSRSAGASMKSTLATRPTAAKTAAQRDRGSWRTEMGDGCKPKDLVGVPWLVAFALRADGWYLRSDIIWSKPNPMPESVTDRPTKSHEYLFLLSKEPRYYYDAAAIAEDAQQEPQRRYTQLKVRGSGGVPGQSEHNGAAPAHLEVARDYATRNARSVWTMATTPYAGAHFATFPEELARRCILAGSAPSDTVLDPFSGSGTVAQVATGNGRAAIGIELNPAYQHLAEHRIGPLLIASLYDPPVLQTRL